jgi:hypothetical protein
MEHLKPTLHSHTHCQVAQRPSAHPKLVKECLCPNTLGTTKLIANILKMNKGQLVTANISKLGISSLLKVSTFNKIFNGLTGEWLRKPSLLILATR